MSFLKKIFTKPKTLTPSSTEPPVPDGQLENQLQSLRLEITARDEQITRLRTEIENLRSRQETLLGERTSSALESLMAELAAPAAQIVTQADLLENQAKPVQARDIMLVARRLVRVLERQGLILEGKPGQQTHYDPALHQPLNAGVNPQLGQPVTIRFAGIRYGGKMLLKAMID